AGPRELFVQDRLLDGWRTMTAILAGPEESHVPRVVERPLPALQELEFVGEGRVIVRTALGAGGLVGGEPRAQRRAEARVVGRIREVHRRRLARRNRGCQRAAWLGERDRPLARRSVTVPCHG